MKKYALMLLVLLCGCASQSDEPPFEINNKQLHTKLDEQGNRPLTRHQFKNFAEQEYFEESNSLKLELEDQAVHLLKQELHDKKYCRNDKYEINEVLWRDLSVRLMGRCL
jgi:hypothetical protein